jgi:hypothetical protein
MVKWLDTLRAGQFAGLFLTPANLQRADRLNLSIRTERTRFFTGDCKGKGTLFKSRKLKAEINVTTANCVFRGLSDTDSNFCRTVFRFQPDTVPIHIGQCSGLMSDSFRASLEWRPRWPGTLSDSDRSKPEPLGSNLNIQQLKTGAIGVIS